MPCILGRGVFPCLHLNIAVCCVNVINKRTNEKALLDIYLKLFLSTMPSIFLPHFIPPPSLPYPTPLHTLLSCYPDFFNPSLVLPPPFPASLLPSLSLAQHSKSLPIATTENTTTPTLPRSSLRRPEDRIPSNKTQKPGKRGNANSKTRKKSEEIKYISRGSNELVSQGNTVGSETDTITGPTQT